MPLPYCTPEDVVLKLDKPPDSIPGDRYELYLQRATSASQEWDTDTGAPMRTLRVGAPTARETWELHSAREAAGGSPPIRADLNHRHVVPIDAGAGDTIEIRVGRNDFRDITADEGDEWVLDYKTGEIRIFRFLINRLYWEDPSDRYLRATYRYGGLGGDRQRGYSTALSSSVDSTATSLSVDDAARFPQPPFTALVGDTTALEYVRVTDVDTGTDTLTVARGSDYTQAVSHDSGDAVNYCPGDVREAVAAKAAELLVINDDADLAIPDNAQLSSRRERAEVFEKEYDSAAAKYSDVRTI